MAGIEVKAEENLDKKQIMQTIAQLIKYGKGIILLSLNDFVVSFCSHTPFTNRVPFGHEVRQAPL